MTAQSERLVTAAWRALGELEAVARMPMSNGDVLLAAVILELRAALAKADTETRE